MTSQISIAGTLNVALIVLVENGFVEKSSKEIDPDSTRRRVNAAGVAQGPLDLALGDVELVGGVVNVGHIADLFFSQVA